MSEGYRNFDEAKRELEGKTAKFTFMGEDFEVDLNVKAFKLMDWMSIATSVEGIPKFLDVFFTEEDKARMRGLDPDWADMQDLMVWLSQELGGDQGN